MQDIKEFSLEELQGKIKSLGAPAYYAQDILSWIYKKGVSEFEQMSSLSLKFRKQLQEDFYIRSLRLAKQLASVDGTEKFLFKLQDNNFIEAVSIPTSERVTGCISTQVGCKFACSFCASGVKGFKRNLTAAEMLDQALALRFNTNSKRLTHIVFMGTGEPLDNYDNLLKAIRIINAKPGLNIGARHITISTSGIVPGILRLAEEGLQVELSVSLHAADDKLRSQIMPINKKYPLPELLNACRSYIRRTNRQITFEYILLNNLNSDLPSARKLSTIIASLKLTKVNLIPSNTIPELNISPPEILQMRAFKAELLKSGVCVTMRRSRGEDIDAACGQLRLRYENK